MAIIQISKIQVRSGNLVDLPQLDDAEFGWASDQKKLYIGKTTPNENIEILTSYSDIYFSQVNGSYGNLDVTTPVTGQTLAYDKASNTWVNAGGNALDPGNSAYYSNAPLHLGNVGDLYIGGGAIGYVLETDGTGNLSWTPKGSITATITNATKANPVVITTSAVNQFTSGMRVTITDVVGMTQLNGNSYYVKILTSTTFALYTDSGLTSSVNGTAYSTYVSGGRAIASVGAGGTGSSGAGGSTYSVQYNSGGISTGDANFQWNYTTQLLSITGTANVTQNINVTGNVTASRLVSNIAVGTAPLVVTSTTRVANLNVATSGIANTVNDAAQPNITSVGTLTSVSVSGNANVGNLGTGGLITATGNITGGNIVTSGIMSSTGNATHGNISTAGLITATGNITGGNLVTGGALSATGNATVGNISATTAVLTTGNITTINSGLLQNGNSSVTIAANGNITITSAGGTPELVITSTGANITGYVSASGNANVANLGTGGLITATGNIQGGNLVTGGLVTATGNIQGGNIITAGIVSATGNLSGGNLVLSNAAVITVGANTNVGTITGNWTLSAGSRLQATYADLAEYYEADEYYPPGTVVEFGGEKEVTIAEDGTTRVAGVVSTDPAYVMNTKCPGIATAVALQGRVPVKVRGKVSKGDMMVSGGNGFARPTNSPQLGTIIGKSLENFEGGEGIIEIAVGRL